MFRRFVVATALAGLTFSPALLSAQEQPQPQPQPQPQGERGDRGDRDRGDRGGRGSFDPARFREQMEARMKEQLSVNDEEWKVMQPKLEKVMEARREAGGFGGGFGGRGGFSGRGGGDDDNRQRSAVEQTSRELRELLENKDAPADQITAKLTALREAREKARTNLQTAQKELKEILTQRQEAVLVTMGMLE